MGYRNAEDVLPVELVEQIQEYVKVRVYTYPRKVKKKKLGEPKPEPKRF